MNPERKKIIEELIQIQKERWSDAIHCTCLGFAIVQIAGGEDSKEGMAVTKRLMEINNPKQDE